MQFRQLGNYAVQTTRQLGNYAVPLKFKLKLVLMSLLLETSRTVSLYLSEAKWAAAINVVALGAQSGMLEESKARQGGAWAASSCPSSPAPPSDCFTYLTIIDLAMHNQEDFQMPKHF